MAATRKSKLNEIATKVLDEIEPGDDGKRVPKTFYLSQKALADLERIAKQKKRNASYIVDKLIKAFIEEAEGK